MIYLAFDFGDGTTCASRFDSSLNEPEVPNIVKGQQEIWTNIAFDKNGENPVIGLKGSKRGYTIVSNWKSKPSKLDAEAWERKTAIEFMRESFKLFLSNNPEYSDGQKWTGMCNGQPCRVVIGVPCDWSDEDIFEYRKMADEAGLPDVQIFKESQAAVLFARKFMAAGLPDEYLENGVLMIDIGSSTTDFTYMKGLRATHCGLTLGAKYVEQAFLGDAMQRTGYEYFKESGDAESKEQGRRLRAANLLSVRQWKESFFSEAQQANPDVETTPLPGSELKVGDIEDGVAYITTEFVDRCLNDASNGVTFSLPHLSDMWKNHGMDGKNTWRGHFRQALRCVEDLWKIDVSKLTIFVTGGASRMGFVENDIKSVYGKDVRCVLGNDRERSFSVVKGLAWTAYATDLIQDKRESLGQEIKNVISKHDKIVGDKVLYNTLVVDLLQSIADTIASKFVYKLADKMRSDPSSLNTRRKMERFGRENVTELLRGIQIEQRISTLAKKLLATKEMLGLFSALQENLGRADIYMKRPELPIEQINLPKDFEVNIDIASITEKILDAIYWAIALALAWFTYGLSVLVAWAGKKVFFDKGPDEIIESDKIKSAADKVSEQKDDISKKILTALMFSPNGESYHNKVMKLLYDFLYSVKLQELNALEGLFNYEEQ